MQTIWVLTANASKAKIYSILRKNIVPIKELEHPATRLKKQELVTDTPGRMAQGAYVGSSPKENEVITFAKKISKELEHARTTNQFSKLIICASPHFLGHLKTNLDKPLIDLTKLFVPKDFTYITHQELFDILQEEYYSSLTKNAEIA